MADYSDLIAKYSKKYGVPEKLVQQLINVESSGNAQATSPTGPRGLMQVSRAVAEEAGYSRADMYDPEKNIDAGTKYLAKNLEAFGGNIPHALLGYNQGTGGAKQMIAGKIPMAKEGYNYIRNKKFSPEYISKDANIPKPSETESTDTLIGMGKQGVEPEKPKYDSASLIQSTQPAEQTQPPAQKEPNDLDKLNMYSTKIQGLFNNAAAYQNTAADKVQRGFLDQWMNQSPALKNAAALFGGFK